MIAARIVPLRLLPVLGEMNSDDQRGAARVIHNVIDVAPERRRSSTRPTPRSHPCHGATGPRGHGATGPRGHGATGRRSRTTATRPEPDSAFPRLTVPTSSAHRD